MHRRRGGFREDSIDSHVTVNETTDVDNTATLRKRANFPVTFFSAMCFIPLAMSSAIFSFCKEDSVRLVSEELFS